MPERLSKSHLRELRNRVEIIPLIADVLEVLYKTHDGRFRFMCPLCHDFDSAVNTDTNLARCFRCQRNFNPIDMVMIVKRYSFIQAVRYLQPMLDRFLTRADDNAKRRHPSQPTHP
jgi:hypothetical protein